jgi:glycosyltransferase involved in cell wall biosynthesis
MNTTKSGIGACTIIAKNYLAQARVLAESFLTHHPGAQFFVLLTDEPPHGWNASKEIFETILLSELGIENINAMRFQYTIKELNTAVKPFLLEHLLWKRGMERILYLDPDILVLAPLEPLYHDLTLANVLLTPHLLHPIEGDVYPGERVMMRVGTYNLGFIGVRQSGETKQFLVWWGKRLQNHCIEDVHSGLFVDQKWIDLAPGFFKGFAVCRDPGCNVAYWNLQERPIVQEKNGYTVRGFPLRFFHFSGYRPESPKKLTMYTSSHTLQEQEVVQELCAMYKTLLEEHGYSNARSLPYTFTTFENGVLIPDIARTSYRTSTNLRERFPQPFAGGAGSFFAWLQEPVITLRNGAFLMNIHRLLHEHSPDLRSSFPHINHSSTAHAFGRWLLHPLQRERLRIDDVFLESLLPLWRSSGVLAHLLPAMVWKAARKARRICSEYQRIARLRLARWRLRLGRQIEGIALPRMSTVARASGVNVMGYFGTASGLSTGVRMTIAALSTAHVPYVCNAPVIDTTIEGCTRHHPYATNLLNVNADQVPMVLAHWGSEYFAEKRNIGIWLWELSSFPKQWLRHARHFAELWVPSTFIADSLRSSVPIPVHVIPYPVVLPPQIFPMHGRAHFRLPHDTFLFCFIFDFLSIFERKNPLAVITAFHRAFGPDEPVHLVIKTINSERNPLGWNRLAFAAQDPRIHLIDSTMTREETIDLLRCSDAYISLHRSEGFGFTIAEAMALGKPVIATDYGGNTDFLDEETGFPVRYMLRELTEDFGPYAKGNVWAEPDLEHAAAQMRFVYENAAEAYKRGAAAAKRIKERFSCQTIGNLMREQLGLEQESTILSTQCTDSSKEPSARPPSTVMPCTR